MRRKRRIPVDHPGWKVAQTALAVAGIVVIVLHRDAHVTTTPDVTDVVGIGGLSLAGKLLWQQLWKS
jgi:hypothetical protein